MSNPITMYDFTLKSDGVELNDLKKKLRSLCKKYVFQLERGETGYEHYQGRVQLQKKMRLVQIKQALDYEQIHLSPTTNITKANGKFDYVMKEQTKIDGPWTDQDNQEDVYIPRQYRLTKLFDWQQQLYDDVMEDLKVSTRNIFCLVDINGGIGKTTFALYLTCHKKAEYIPPMNDAKDIMRMIYDLPPTTMYIVDLTRSMRKDKLFGLFSAIEQIKNGYIYDDRYSFKRRFIDTPGMIIFTNDYPDTELVSSDRWKLCTVTNGHLEYPSKDNEVTPNIIEFEEE